MNILTISSLYPNAAQPRHGIFIETRMRLYSQRYPAHKVTVIAPLPWFPLQARLTNRGTDYQHVAAHYSHAGISVHHPKYLAIPGLGMYLNPFFMFISLWLTLRNLRQTGQQFDLVDAHYLYPDAVAASWLAKMLGLPVFVSARGSDVNRLPLFKWPGFLIKRCLRKADSIIAVSQALASRITALTNNGNAVSVIRNGVDSSMFYPEPSSDSNTAKAHADTVSAAPFKLLCVGNLVALKGHLLLLEALTSLPDTSLDIIGEGDMLLQLQNFVKTSGIADRVTFHSNQPQSVLRRFYSDADALVLASEHEGWPNVLLEAMSCGCPVVVSPFDSAREIVQSANAGIIATQRSAQGLAAAIRTLKHNRPDKQQVVAYAANFSWDASLEQLHQLFSQFDQIQSTTNGGVSNAG